MDQSQRPPMRIIDLQWRDLPNGYESEATFEMTPANGAATVIREFWRHMESGDSYTTIRHAARGSAPAQTFVVFGKKGDVDGEFRTDTTEMLTFHADGTLSRTEQTVKTWLKGDAMRAAVANWYREGKDAGLTPDEIFPSDPQPGESGLSPVCLCNRSPRN